MQNFRKLAGASALGVFAITLFDILLAMMPGWGAETLVHTSEEWFLQADNSPLLALRNLDVLNALAALVALPIYLGLTEILLPRQKTVLALSLLALVSGTLLMLVNNGALPLWQLKTQLASATPQELERIYAASTLVLAQGGHGTVASTFAFLLATLGTLGFNIGLVKVPGFRKLGLLALVGSSLLALYLVITLATGTVIVGLAMPGGILMLIWYGWLGKVCLLHKVAR